jgi:hypothetical protein
MRCRERSVDNHGHQTPAPIAPGSLVAVTKATGYVGGPLERRAGEASWPRIADMMREPVREIEAGELGRGRCREAITSITSGPPAHALHLPDPQFEVRLLLGIPGGYERVPIVLPPALTIQHVEVVNLRWTENSPQERLIYPGGAGPNLRDQSEQSLPAEDRPTKVTVMPCLDATLPNVNVRT